MTCEERQDLLPMYALGTLEPAEMESLRRHLATGCPACQAALAEAQSLTSHLALALEPVAPPAHVRERLMQRVAVSQSQAPAPMRIAPTPPVAHRPSTFADWARSLTAAAAAAAVVYLVAAHSFDRRAAGLQQQLATVETQLSEMKTTQDHASQMVDLVRSPAVQFVSLQGTKSSPDAKGNLYWDKARGVWYFYVTGLKPLKDQSYELWFIAGDKKTRAGVFDVTPSGEGSLVAALPPDLGKITVAAVTNEPIGGSAQPTGQLQLMAAVP